MRIPYDTKQRPMLPMKLIGPAGAVRVSALVDSGADVNVLPWSIGANLGLDWNANKATIRVAGVPQGAAAMPVLIEAEIEGLGSVTLAFAWCQSDAVPLVLGQTNFFMEFEICFFRQRGDFQVVRKAAK